MNKICVAAFVGLALFVPARAGAHCDGLDGPVVKAAEHALETHNPAFALIWVQAKDEPEIRTAFDHTLKVRALGPDAKALADRYFFETLVRVHRAGEGAPYTGLKPAGRDLGPAIPAADKALETAAVEPLLAMFTSVIQERVRAHFREALAAKAYDPADLAAGRRYAQTYVEFIHFVERLYESATTSAHGHLDEADAR